jgi:hypothetical protein
LLAQLLELPLQEELVELETTQAALWEAVLLELKTLEMVAKVV